MKIVFLLENLSERCGANVNIAITLARQLKARNEVLALARYDYEKEIDDKKRQNFHQVEGFFCDELGAIERFLKKNRWSKRSAIQKIFLLLSHPKIAFYMWDAKYNDFKLSQKKCRKALESFCSRQKVDAVIGVTAPYYIARAIASANVECVKSILQLDPYTYNYTLPQKQTKKRIGIERCVLNHIDVPFTVWFVKEEIVKKQIFNNANKLISFQLPGILALGEKKIAKPIKREDGQIHFAFLGRFYKKIREPKFLLELFTHLPKNYILNIIGGGMEKEIEKYKEKLGTRLIRYGWMSSEESKQKMEEADFLINVNNTIDNQLASKLLEYFSTGKPIVNICKRKECLSLEYTKNYRNAIDIFETQGVHEDILRHFIDFVETHKDLRIESTEILQNFQANTDVFVANLVETELNCRKN